LTITKPQNATLIDSISEGYTAINRRPWLVLVPIVLNIYLWFGAPLSLGPLIANITSVLRQAQPPIAGVGDMQMMYDQFLATGGVDLRQQFAMLNWVPTLHMYVVGSLDDGGAGVPSVPEVLRPIGAQRADTIEIATIGGAALAFLAINALALALSALFLGQVGAAVRHMDGARWSVAHGLRQAGRIGLAILGAAGIMLGVALALALPLLFFAGLLLYLNATLGLLAIELLFVIAFWINIYIGFYPEAIVMSERGPLRAIYTSFNVVRRNFWGTLGFLAVSLVITLGSGVIWQRLTSTTVGLIVAIVGSAYIGSGLLAARMAFFRERLRRWESAPAIRPSK